MDFGSIWRHRLGKRDARGRLASPVYYNTTGVVVSSNVRQRPQICGYARFDVIGGFDPHHPSRMIRRVFECAAPSVWMGYNKLLFKRILNGCERPDCFLVVAKSERLGQLLIGKQDWRSPDTWILSLSECAGKQEVMLLMSVGGWIRSSLGEFVLEPSTMECSLARLVLRVPQNVESMRCVTGKAQ
jgi:hypothetical protein